LSLVSVKRVQLTATGTENLNRAILFQDLTQLTPSHHVSKFGT
jgi:hypothetical protein